MEREEDKTEDFLTEDLDRKTKMISLRISPYENDVISMKAEEVGLSKSEYLVRCGMQRRLPKAMSSEELEVWTMLKRKQTDLTRLSNLIKRKDPNLLREIKETVKQIQESLNFIRNGQSS